MEPGHREVTLRWHSSPGGCGQHTALSGWLCCPSVLPVTQGTSRAPWGAGLATHGPGGRAHLVSAPRAARGAVLKAQS